VPGYFCVPKVYIHNSLVHSVVKIIPVTSALRNKPNEVNKLLTCTPGGNKIIARGKRCIWQHSQSGQLTVNEPATGRGVDLKVETLHRIFCVQQQVTFQEFWWTVTDPPFFCFVLFDKLVDSLVMKVFSTYYYSYTLSN
jgi:hypothetical protein